jgi:uncharacterized protein
MENIFLTANWKQLIMANYEVSSEVLLKYLPHGVTLDTYENKTFVSLVGFLFNNSSIFGIRAPFFGSFEEVNLRFYVKRSDGVAQKRGVVFINETVPFVAVAWLANLLYKEHYISIPTRHSIIPNVQTQEVTYEWKKNNHWNYLKVIAETQSMPMQPNSMEEFIFEHYFGYTKVNEKLSQEYRVIHPKWEVNKVIDYTIDCDFSAMYGDNFSFLSQQTPYSVFLAKGSQVAIDWKRHSF